MSGPTLRILYVHPLALPGVEANLVQTIETCRALADLGHEVFLIVPKLKDTREATLAAYGLEPHENLVLVAEPSIRLTKSSGVRSVLRRGALLVWLRSLVRRRRTVIYFRTLRDGKLARFLLLASRWLRVPVVYEAHKIYTEKRGEQGFGAGTIARHERLETRVFSRAHGVVASHPLLFERLRATLRKAAPMITAENGVPPLPRASGAEAFDCVYAGSLFPWKNVDVCVEAAARAGASLAIVGGNPPERLDALKAKAAALGANVTFFGQVPRAQVFDLVSRARIVLVPVDGDSGEGERYTCPLKLLEGMVRGKAVIAADTPALRCFVRDGVDARLVAPNDPVALAAAITELLADEGIRRLLGDAARERALGFTFAARARKVATFLESFVSGVPEAEESS